MTPSQPDAGGPADRALVTVEVVVLTVRAGRLHVLLTEWDSATWALPGAPKLPAESLETCALRRVESELDLPLDGAHLEQLASYGEPGRDPRGNAVAVAHLVLVPDARLQPPRTGARFWAVEDLADGYGPVLALDHGRIVDDAVERTAAKLEYTTLATRLAPDPFTISDLYDVYRAVWGSEPGDRANFARKVTRTAGFVVEADAVGRASGRGRPSRRYRAGAATYLHPPILRPVEPQTAARTS